MGGRRDRAIERIRSLLESAGFFVSDAHTIRPTSFDLLARRDSLLLVVKILKNIDALDPEEARRLKELGELFPAVPLVVGQTSGAQELAEGVVYNRYGIPIIVEESLSDLLRKGLPPFLFSSPGGIFARVDGGRLRELRESRRLSLGALASAAGVSRRTIQLYEDGAGAEVTIVERLEQYLGEPIVQPIHLFPPVTPRGVAKTRRAKEGDASTSSGIPGEIVPPGRGEGRATGPPRPTGDALRDVVFRQLDGMGWEVVVTVRCPFDAFTHGPTRGEEEVVLTSVGSWRTAQHRAEILQQLARVSESHALFVVRELARRSSIDGLPILSMQELKRQRDKDELLDVIAERESS